MKVKVRITFKEYVKLLYTLIYRKPILKLLVAIAIIIMLWIVFYYLHIFNLPKPLIYQYIPLILIAVVQPIGIYMTIRRNYNSSNHLKEMLEMELTPEDLKIRGESFYTEVLLHKMFKISEERNWFLIYQNNLSAILIPKKDMQNNQINDFRKILKGVTNIPVELLQEPS